MTERGEATHKATGGIFVAKLSLLEYAEHVNSKGITPKQQVQNT